METIGITGVKLGLYWGTIGIMENKMETIGITGVKFGVVMGYCWDNGK